MGHNHMLHGRESVRERVLVVEFMIYSSVCFHWVSVWQWILILLLLKLSNNWLPSFSAKHFGISNTNNNVFIYTYMFLHIYICINMYIWNITICIYLYKYIHMKMFHIYIPTQYNHIKLDVVKYIPL